MSSKPARRMGPAASRIVTCPRVGPREVGHSAGVTGGNSPMWLPSGRRAELAPAGPLTVALRRAAAPPTRAISASVSIPSRGTPSTRGN
jgi:hypothetical protein